MHNIVFCLFYAMAIGVLFLHFTGWLSNHDAQWVVYLVAVAVFPVVIFL